MHADEIPVPVAMHQMMTGYWVAKALNVAAELAAADLLREGPRTSDELAAAF